MKIVYARWQDAQTFTNWSTKEDVLESKPKACSVAGFLLQQDKQVTKIGLLSSDGSGTLANWIVIPTMNITDLEVIKEVPDEDC